MRKLLATIVALAVAGCGDGGNDNKTPALSGKLRGQTFDPAEVVFATPQQSTSCTFPGVPITYGIGDTLIAFSPQAGACALADPCQGRKSFTFVAGLVAHAQVPAASEAPTLDAGSYSVYPSLNDAVTGIATNPTGPIRAALLEGVRTDAQCVPASDGATGTIRVDSVSATELRGEIDVTFADGQGGFLKGPFTAKICSGAGFDACFSEAGLTCSGTPTCQ